jgi:hypothetical protein
MPDWIVTERMGRDKLLAHKLDSGSAHELDSNPHTLREIGKKLARTGTRTHDLALGYSVDNYWANEQFLLGSRVEC